MMCDWFIMGGWQVKAKMMLFTLLALYISSREVHAVTVRMAWLANINTVYFFNASTSLGALATSVEEIQNDTAGSYTFDIKFRNSACNPRAAVGAIFELLEDNSWPIDVILGPVCSEPMEPVAQLASYLDKPVLGWISSNPPLKDKETYSTLIRTLWSITNLAEGLVLLMVHFNWNRVFLVSSKGGDYGTVGISVKDRLEEGGYNVVRWVPGVDLDESIAEIRNIYSMVKQEARIIVLVTPEKELRNWALAAYKSGMHEGDYVFIYLNQQTADPVLYAQITDPNFCQTGDADDVHVRKSLASFFMILAKTESFNITDEVLAGFTNNAHSPHWKTRFPQVPPATSDFYSLFLWDAMKIFSIYGIPNLGDGTDTFQAARGAYIEGGATGDIILDDACDRIADYYVLKRTRDDVFGVVGSTVTKKNGTSISRKLEITGELIWGSGKTGENNAPPDTPKCGFDNELCPPLVLYIVPAVIGFVVIVTGIIFYFVYRKVSYEKDLANMAWKLNYSDMNVYSTQHGGNPTMRAQSSIRKSRASFGGDSENAQMFVMVANYRGTIVAIKTIQKPRIDVNRALLQEMNIMLELKHPNLNTFIGACIEPPNIVVAWEYCNKGSLQDVINNDSMKLDDMFKFSICIEILKGLSFLHESSLNVHGRLSSNNTLIDGRWSCKLTDYGLVTFMDGQAEDSELSHHAHCTRFQWTAPEVLRESWRSLPRASKCEDLSASEPLPPYTLRSTTQAADIYAVGIIFKEVFCRNTPYAEVEDHLSPYEIVQKVKQEPDGDPPFRPSLSELPKAMESDQRVAKKLIGLINDLWVEDPRNRLTAPQAARLLTKINPFKSTNVMDNMLAMMEKYSTDLEEQVAQRTIEFREEQKKTETLLYRMLPKTVAEELKMGKPVDAESFELVTIYFSDIHGFTEFTNECTPFEVVEFLNGVYILFDETIGQHDVYKVETVMDVYVLVSGLPVRNGDCHIVEMANCALDIMSGVLSYKLPSKPDFRLKIRIGIHTGPIVSGVVGLTMPRYCLFGDTMNTASRMESHGAPMRMHLSPQAYAALSKFGGYLLADRGKVQVKGKGEINTYWLLGKQGFDKPLPDYNEVFGNDNPPPTRLPPTQGKTVSSRVIRPSTESGFSETCLMDNSATNAETSATNGDCLHQHDRGLSRNDSDFPRNDLTRMPRSNTGSASSLRDIPNPSRGAILTPIEGEPLDS